MAKHKSGAEWEKIARDIVDDEKEEIETLEDLEEKMRKTPRGMFVSGWDDPDDLIEEDKDPTASLERLFLWAAGEDKLDIVEEVIAKKPSVITAIDDDGYTALHKACYNNSQTMAELLLQNGADPNARTELGWTPLHSACKWNNAECVALLLQHGADINAVSQGDQAPLHIAASVSNSRRTLMTLMMDERINPNLKNNSGETAADIARRSGHLFPMFKMAQSALMVETGILD
ncbi:ankyrin repeat domain-containing protein 49 [Topomyia yanbarensis]|uniref:ankyrin repeat domain-containing protein 49 n=1 Tax=Topomyia yanbarensis TaxID=2498891 RepID=UPI00273C18C0|nr:ankyrin repeat domain-containing protein 49 [Topomyia yanbarensis]